MAFDDLTVTSEPPAGESTERRPLLWFKVVLLNDNSLGKIAKVQHAERYEVWQTSLHNPDFAAYAELCGALGPRVTNADQPDDALARALAHNGPALVEVVCDPDLV